MKDTIGRMADFNRFVFTFTGGFSVCKFIGGGDGLSPAPAGRMADCKSSVLAGRDEYELENILNGF